MNPPLAPGREFQPSRGCGHSPGPPALQEPAFRGLILSELFGERPRQRNEARPRPGPASGLRSVRLNKHCPSRPGRERVCAHMPVHVCVCPHVCGLCMCVPVCLCTSARVHLCVHVCLCAHECMCAHVCTFVRNCLCACAHVRALSVGCACARVHTLCVGRDSENQMTTFVKLVFPHGVSEIALGSEAWDACVLVCAVYGEAPIGFPRRAVGPEVAEPGWGRQG